MDSQQKFIQSPCPCGRAFVRADQRLQFIKKLPAEYFEITFKRLHPFPLGTDAAREAVILQPVCLFGKKIRQAAPQIPENSTVRKTLRDHKKNAPHGFRQGILDHGPRPVDIKRNVIACCLQLELVGIGGKISRHDAEVAESIPFRTHQLPDSDADLTDFF